MMILSGLKTLLETGELLTTPGSQRWLRGSAPRARAGVDSTFGPAAAIALSARKFGALSLGRKPRRDLFAMIALDFDHAVFHGPARAAMTLERLRRAFDFRARHAVHETDGTCAASLASDSDDTVGRHRRFRRYSGFRRARFGRLLPPGVAGIHEFSIVVPHDSEASAGGCRPIA